MRATQRPLAVVKLGGGLITDKRKECTIDAVALQDMAKCLAQVFHSGTDLILVHGAGSFGHLKAKRWKLHLGRQESCELDLCTATTQQVQGTKEAICSQDEAVAAVQADMKRLNGLVVQALEAEGVPCDVLCPHEIGFQETGMHFIAGSLGIKSYFQSHLCCEGNRRVAVTFGDVVPCSSTLKDFGILSGDDLMYRIAVEVEGVSSVVFVLDDVDGLLQQPPEEGHPQQVISLWSGCTSVFSGAHNAAIDVTGGIFLKAERSLQIAKHGIPVVLVRGIPDRVFNACLNRPCMGTLVKSPSVSQ